MPSTVEPLTEPQDQTLRTLLSYWREKKGSRTAPSRTDIQPEELAPLRPYLALYDVLDGDFRVRLFGSGLVLAYDGNITGKLMSDCDLNGINKVFEEMNTFQNVGVTVCNQY